MSNQAEQLARAWIDGWNAGKPDDLPLAADFTHSSPFGVMHGRDNYLQWVKPLAAKNVTSLKILRTIAGDKEAAIWFEMGTLSGPVKCCDWVQSRDGGLAR